MTIEFPHKNIVINKLTAIILFNGYVYAMSNYIKILWQSKPLEESQDKTLHLNLIFLNS